MSTLDGLIAESEKGARRYLKQFLKGKVLTVNLLSEHTKDNELDHLLEPLLKGERWGLISDAGLPCIADPGNKLVFLARKKGVEVKALCGPSSIMLALMLSGLSGQNFAFNGYLPYEEGELKKRVLFLQNIAFRDKSTQIWMETPYRVMGHMRSILKVLREDAYLCVAMNLTGKDERVICERVLKWRQASYDFGKVACLFLLSK
jgi:16S rRNA (cytidine1402-2'-O)-methyltransferase